MDLFTTLLLNLSELPMSKKSSCCPRTAIQGSYLGSHCLVLIGTSLFHLLQEDVSVTLLRKSFHALFFVLHFGPFILH